MPLVMVKRIGVKRPVTNTDDEIAIPVGIKRIPDN